MDTKKLAKSLEEISLYNEGKIQLKVTAVAPPQVDVKVIRSRTGLTQKDFADHFGFSTAAIRNWEQGLREPEGPARTLLSLIDRNPKLIEQEIQNLRMAA